MTSGNFVLDIFNAFGVHLLFGTMCVVYLFLLFNVNLTWQCGSCGKINQTGFIKFALQMCDHFGLR